MAIYNQIGTEYNLTRTADPYLTGRIYYHLFPDKNGLYLDIGCGTGNYLKSLSDKGLNFYGLDPSEVMLEKAKLKNPGTKFVQATAEHIPFPDNTFDGAIAMFTFHHWSEQQKALKEINRVLKPGSKIVFLTFTPEQLQGYWLCHYFPDMMNASMDIVPDQKTKILMLEEAGYNNVETEKYFIHDDLKDQFLYAGKHQPEKYLNQGFRNNISSFSAFSNANEVKSGLLELEKDIKSGVVNFIIQSYENDLGDYLFISAVKN